MTRVALRHRVCSALSLAALGCLPSTRSDGVAPLSSAERATVERLAFGALRHVVGNLARLAGPMRVELDPAAARRLRGTAHSRFVRDSIDAALGPAPARSGAVVHYLSITGITRQSDSTAVVGVLLRPTSTVRCAERLYSVLVVKRRERWESNVVAATPKRGCEAQL